MKLKRFLAVLCSLSLIASLIIPAAFAVDETKYELQTQFFDFYDDGSGLAYKIVDSGKNEVMVGAYYEFGLNSDGNKSYRYLYQGEKTIPDTVTYKDIAYTVVGIDRLAFQNTSDITSITLPADSEAFQTIGEQAFQSCPITSLVVPSSVKTLGNSAFYGSQLQSIALNEGLERIDNFAFANCKRLKTLTLPDSVKSIGAAAFAGCSALANITIPAGAAVDAGIFNGTANADPYFGEGKITFADGSKYKIQDGILYDDESLMQVYALQEAVSVPDGIKYIGEDAFKIMGGATDATLKSITFPSTLESIGKGAFYGNTGLKEIVIPKSVTSLGAEAFMGCAGITELTIQAQLAEIPDYAFSGTSITSIILPETVKKIGSNAFEKCGKLTSIDIPDAVTEIGASAFNYCEALKTVELPAHLQTIETRTFFRCTQLNAIQIPEGVTTIGDVAFGNCNMLNAVTLPRSMASIRDGAFVNTLKEDGAALVMQSETVPILGADVFRGASDKLAVYCPEAAKAAYEAAFTGKTKGFALAVEKTTVNAYSGSTVTLALTMTKPDGATVEWTANAPAVAEVSSSSDTALVLSVKSAGQATFTGTMKVGDLVLKTVTIDLTGQTVPSSGGDGGSSKPSKPPQTQTETKTEGSVTTETSTTTTTNKDGSTTTEKTEVSKDTTTGASTEVKTMHTISKDGNTKTTEQVKSEVAADGAKTETKTTVFEDTKTGVSAQAEVVKDSAGKATATVSAQAQAEVTKKADGTASATVDSTAAAKLIEQAKAAAESAAKEAGDVKATVTITVDSGASAKAVEVSIPAETITAAAQLGAEVKVASGAAEITFGKEAAATVGKEAGQNEVVQLEVKQSETTQLPQAVQAELAGASVIELNLFVGDDKVSQFGGAVTVSIPYTAKDANKAILVYHIADDGTKSLVPGARLEDGKVVFETQHFSHYAILEDDWQNPFADVKDTAWYYQAVRYANKNGLFAGTSEISFSPDAAMTREMLWTVLGRLSGVGMTGADVFEQARQWAVSTAVSDGTNGGAPLTREQMVTMLYRYAGSPSVNGSLSGYTDASNVGGFAVDAMTWAVGTGIISGTTATTLSPQGSATRAQVAMILMRFTENSNK